MVFVDAAVVGAGGPTGKLCVQQLLAAGKSVRAVVRSPDKYKNAWPEDDKLEIVRGDVTDPSTLHAALEGAKSVIFTAAGPSYFGAKAVENEGVRNVAEVARQTGSHVVLLSASLVTPKNRLHPVRLLLNFLIRRNMMNEKLLGEAALRGGNISHTVVRPGRFAGTAGHARIIATQGDNDGQGWIPMSDVAAVLVAAALNPARAKNLTLEIKVDPKGKAGPDDLDHLFDGLEPYVHDFGKSGDRSSQK